MKVQRKLPQVKITDKGMRKLAAGHVWVFAGEVIAGEDKEGSVLVDGELCDVISQKGRYLGTGFYNSASLIRVRIISKNANDCFTDSESIMQFWKRRVQYAINYRRTIFTDADFSSCRLIFGEADGFPGLTVDKFESVLVCQCMCLGIEKIKLTIYRFLIEALAALGCSVSAIYERNDSALREKEGLIQGKGFLNEALGLPPVQDTGILICENGVKYLVDFCNGQKTGFFLDQKYNRLAVSRIARGKSVLDCFTHTGSFGLNCLAHGAAHVSFVDVSSSAISETKANAALNGFDEQTCDFFTVDAFTFLEELKAAHKTFDLVILDPPAFTKSTKTIRNALKGYREINQLGMSVLKRGGFLATASCSHFASDELFVNAVSQAAHALNLSVKQIAKYSAAPDHPILWDVPETAYLKFLLLQLV